MEDQILKPLSNLKKAKPSESLQRRIESAIFNNNIIPLNKVVFVAASFLLLLFTNIYVIKNNQINNSAETSSVYDNQLINDFQIY